jgi:hypothetical protein
MPCMSIDLGFFNRYTPMIPKNDGIERRLAKPNPPSSRKAMIEVNFGDYLSGHEPKPTATQSSQTLGYR